MAQPAPPVQSGPIVFTGQTGKFTYRMLATVLAGESLAVFFGALVARGITASDGDPGKGSTYLWTGIGLAVLCIVGAGVMRKPWGVTLGWLIQLAVLASGLIVPMMFIVGLLFGALWVTCLVQGYKIDRLQAKWASEAQASDRADAASD